MPAVRSGRAIEANRAAGCDNLSMSSNEHPNRLLNSVTPSPSDPQTHVPTNQPSKTAEQNKRNKTKLFHNVRIGTINVQTAKDEIKLAEYVIQVKSLKHDICFFQETHKIGSGEVEFDDPLLKGWRVLYTGFKRKAQAGAAIVLAPHVILDDIMDIELGRIIGARVRIRGLKLSVFSCYAPTDTKSYSDQIKNNFYHTLRKSVSSVKKDHPSYKLVIGGDFNATIGNDFQTENSKCIGKNNDPNPTSENGHRLLQFAHENNLSIMNTLFGHKNIHRWSFHSNLGYDRRLDYILGEWFVKRFSHNCRVYRGASKPFESDHKLVVLDCRFPYQKELKKIFKPKHPKKHYDIRQLRDNKTIADIYSNKLEEILLDATSNDQNIDSLNNAIVESINKASENTIPLRSKSSDAKPWVNSEFLDLITQRNRCKKQNEWKTLNCRVKKMRDKLKNDYYSEKAKSINEASEARNVEEQFRLAKQYSALSNSERLLIKPELLTEHFTQHFSKRLVSTQPEVENPSLFPHILPPESIAIDEGPPTEAELVSAKKSFNNNKCQGTDKIYAEQIKYCTSKHLIVYLLLLLTTIWNNASVPIAWLTSSISCLHKKGSKSNPGNYRAISIMSTVSKLLPKIILQRLRDSYEILLMENQFGFRKNRSTTDAIFITREAIKSTASPLFLCMIDLKAAYDHIDRNLLFSVLEIRTKSSKITSILRSLYTGTIAAIKHTDTLFDIHTGCRQGGLNLLLCSTSIWILFSGVPSLKFFKDSQIQALSTHFILNLNPLQESNAASTRSQELNVFVCSSMLMILYSFAKTSKSLKPYSRSMIRPSLDMD